MSDIDPFLFCEDKIPLPLRERYTPPEPTRSEKVHRAFVSFATRMAEMKVAGEIQRPIEDLPAYKAAEQYDTDVRKAGISLETK